MTDAQANLVASLLALVVFLAIIGGAIGAVWYGIIRERSERERLAALGRVKELPREVVNVSEEEE